MAEVDLKKVRKEFNRFNEIKKAKETVVVVKDVDIGIKDGEFLVLVGPSGCGKSTTLRMIAGLEEITSGEIYIDSKLVNDVSPKDRDIAMVFQNYALYPHMNVYENMAFGLKLRKFSKDEIQKRVEDAAKLLDIKHLLSRKPKELSGGQRQRVAMGRAIVREPKVFLMDEPLSNLDAKLRVQMRAELQKLHHRLGITTVYVTHDQTEAMTLGHRIVVMKDGIIQQMDTPLHLYEHPANKFVAGFIGSPSMNFIECDLINEDSSFLINSGSLKLKLPPDKTAPLKDLRTQKTTFGIRPEDIYDKNFVDPNKLNPDWVTKAKVEVMEPMGSEVYLYLKIDELLFTARVDPHTSAMVGEDLEIFFDMKKIHLFRSDTEEAVF